MTVISLATLCHSQRKYGKATRTYREAICITRKAVMNGDFRRVVLSWLRISGKASLGATPVKISALFRPGGEPGPQGGLRPPGQPPQNSNRTRGHLSLFGKSRSAIFRKRFIDNDDARASALVPGPDVLGFSSGRRFNYPERTISLFFLKIRPTRYLVDLTSSAPTHIKCRSLIDRIR